MVTKQASSNSERARSLRRLLQHMLEVQSITCRANNHRGLVVRGSLQEESRRRIPPQRGRLGAMAEGTLVKIDARAAQAMHVLHEKFTGHVNDVGEKPVGHHRDRGWNLSLGKRCEDRSHGEHNEKFSAPLGSCFACFGATTRGRLTEACIFSRLGCTGSLRTQRASSFTSGLVIQARARFAQHLCEKQKSSSSCARSC